MRIFLYVVIAFASCALVGAVTLRVMCSRDLARIADAAETLAAAPSDAPVRHADLEALPAPARRYLKHALVEGSPRRTAVDLEVQGEVLLGPDQGFAPYTAHHRIAAGRGYVWQADVKADGLSLVGAEMLLDGSARASFWWHSFVPSGQEGPDLDRAAWERLAFDSIYLPHALWPGDGVSWTPVDDRRAAVTIRTPAGESTLILEVDDDGALRAVESRRWGNQTDDHAFTAIPFGCVVHEEATFDGITIPTRLSFSWWRGSDREREFSRPTILRAAFE